MLEGTNDGRWAGRDCGVEVVEVQVKRASRRAFVYLTLLAEAFVPTVHFYYRSASLENQNSLLPIRRFEIKATRISSDEIDESGKCPSIQCLVSVRQNESWMASVLHGRILLSKAE